MAGEAFTDSPGVSPGNTSNVCNTVVLDTATYILDGGLLFLSIVIFIFLAFMKRRVRVAPNCCHGRPGLPVPMDFLIAPKHRWIYVAIFSVMAVSTFVTFSFFNSRDTSSQNIYFNLFLKLLIWPSISILLISLQFFPLFACVDSFFPSVGHVFGLVYSILWYTSVLAKFSSSYIQQAESCSGGHKQTNSTTLVLSILKDAPNIIVCGIIFLWYTYQVIVDAIKCLQRASIRRQGFNYYSTTTTNNVQSSLCKDYHILRVKTLLKKPLAVEDTQSAFRKHFMRAFKYIFPFDRHFRLPLPFIGAVAAMIMLLYQFCFLIGFAGISISEYFRIIYTRYINSTGDKLTDDILRTAFIGLPTLFVVSPILSLIVCLLMLVHMIGSISKMMKAVARQGFTEKLPGTLSRVPASWKYIGIQIGFFTCAWLIYYLIFVVLGLIVIGLYICLRIPTTRSVTINALLGLLIPLLWAKAIFYSQYLICKVLFFADREGKFISITNRSVFNWFSYILFFYNGLAGFVGALFRIALSAFFSLIQLFRLDEVALMNKFASFDFGHKAFLGFFYLDYAYNNAVVHVFVKVLSEAVEENRSRESSTLGSPGVESGEGRITATAFPPPSVYRHERIRNRWLVAYTLLRNPSVKSLTATNLTFNEETRLCATEDTLEENNRALMQVNA